MGARDDRENESHCKTAGRQAQWWQQIRPCLPGEAPKRPASLTYLSHEQYTRFVMKTSFRTSIDIPATLHKRLHETAAKKGCSARQLILRSIERLVQESESQRPKRRLGLDRPIIASTGRPFDLSNAQIYDLIEFP